MIKVGEIYTTNNDGDLEILEIKNNSNVVVRFSDTGFIKHTCKASILCGAVKDYLSPSIYGRGYLGEGSYNCKDYPLFCSKWRSMFKRCYDEKELIRNPSYKGCTVCSDWYNFQNFAKWCDENYPDDGKVYHLDKDIKVEGNKIYSPDTCMFVSPSDNIVKANAKHYTLKSPEGSVVKFHNMSEFCRENGLDSSNVFSVLRGKRGSCKGWTKV